MSQAFVKETDPADELPDREISPHPNYVTAEGLALIEARVAEFQHEYAAAQTGNKPGNKSGNDPNEIDRARLARAARELRYWTARRQSARLVPPAEDDGRVRFGSRVTLRGEGGKRSYRIVGEDEADPAKGSLSYVSPLARALIGKEEGDRVTIGAGDARDAAREFEIVRVRA